MKLLNCHIENFGALSHFDFTFDPALSRVYAPNGGGKTTLAAFIKAMFYGLPADSSRSKFNERRHYYPFSGGKFGGNLTFEKGGAEYRIERFFDRTSGDDARLFCNGLPCALPEGGIGGHFLGLDELSFSRTLFITTERGELSATGGISARLAALSSQTEGSGAQTAAASLERAAKTLQSRGGRGRIAECDERAKKLRSEIANLQTISEGLGEKYARSSSLASRISSLESSLALSGGAAVAAAERRKIYQDLQADAARASARAAQLAGEYPAGFPVQDDVAILNSASSEGRKKNDKRAMYAPAYISLALSLLLIVAGCALLAFNTFIGIAAASLGVLFGIATAFVMFGGKKGKKILSSRADEVLKKYNLSGMDYSSAAAKLSRDIAEYAALKEQADLASSRALSYAQGSEITPTESPQGEQLSALRRELASVDRDISDDESVISVLPQRQAELEAALAEAERLKNTYADYTAAAQLIRQAEQTMNASLVAPVAQAFQKYSRLLQNALGDSVYVDKNFAVAFEGGGELRPEGHMSGGQRAIVSLCYRLALADTLFGGDSPFVILDDPFCELDGEHMARAASLLSELSRGRQIIYFYCHPSRAV